jgi:hypothetical protein
MKILNSFINWLKTIGATNNQKTKAEYHQQYEKLQKRVHQNRSIGRRAASRVLNSKKR